MSESCFHCGLPVPEGAVFTVSINKETRPMCCPGCQAVAEAIVEAGMEDYYRFRTDMPETGQSLVPDELKTLQAYDHPSVQQQFARESSEGEREASLILEGITCAACLWLNERHIASLPGVHEVSINYSTHKARVRWDPEQIQLSEILEAITHIGYRAHPFDPSRQDEILARERKTYLRRLGVSGVLGMQIMILSVALYAGDWWGMEPGIETFFRWVGLVVTVPLLIFGSRPFFEAAWRDLRHRKVGMDVPVALGMSIAFVASAVATVRDQGEVYFDSVAMFTFLLLTARFLEMAGRKRAAEATDALVRLQPAVATRVVIKDGQRREEAVAATELAADDLVMIRPGETVPADGRVEEGHSSLDESLLTGESLPVSRAPGDQVVGGSTNVESPLLMRVEAVGPSTVLASILGLLDRAQAEKPTVARLADRVAARFVLLILSLAVAVAAYWYLSGSEHWLPITISMLVVTCPCALSLATPAALTASTGQLAQMGLLTTRGHALETLSKVTDMVFDKTGTLTEGRPELANYLDLSSLERGEALSVAAALERQSEHPLGRALVQAAENMTLASVEGVRNEPGQGLEGQVGEVLWRVGGWGFVSGLLPERALPSEAASAEANGQTLVFIGNGHGGLGAFVMGDRIRSDAQETIQSIQRIGLRTHLYTGDRQAAARKVSNELHIDEVKWSMQPQDKLDAVRDLEANGAVVAMVGDGVNDAPVLAGAAVSVAVGSGTRLAAASADMVLLNDQLLHLPKGIEVSRRTMGVIRQNLVWALGYNLIAIPAAAMGWVEPWMAAIGMSLSSLLVVINAMRLTRHNGSTRSSISEH